MGKLFSVQSIFRKLQVILLSQISFQKKWAFFIAFLPSSDYIFLSKIILSFGKLFKLFLPHDY